MEEQDDHLKTMIDGLKTGYEEFKVRNRWFPQKIKEFLKLGLNRG